MEIKINDNVIIKEDVENLDGHSKFAQEKQIPLTVYAKNGNLVGVYTRDLAINNYQNNPFNIEVGNLKIVKKTALKKLLRKANKINTPELREKLKIINTKRLALNKRKDYSYQNKQFLNTTGNYIILSNCGELEKNNYNTDTVFGNTLKPGVVCCSPTKTTSDIITYIPKSWLKYFGYSEVDLKKYIKFLSDTEIGFKAIILGVKKLSKIKNFENKDNKNKISLYADSNNLYQNINENYYEIFIKGDPKYRMHTYIRFICMRFIYSSLYWNIPTIAMKLKLNLPKLTNWECLLLAHATENYNGYYSLVNNQDGKIALPSGYNSPARLMKTLELSTMMNNSFKYYSTYEALQIRKAIKDEDYKTIEEIVKKYRDVN